MSADTYLPISGILNWPDLPDLPVRSAGCENFSVNTGVIKEIMQHNRPRSIAQFGCKSPMQAVEFIDIANNLGWSLDVTCIDPRLRSLTAPISYKSIMSTDTAKNYFHDFIHAARLSNKSNHIITIGDEIVATKDILWMSVKLRHDGRKYDLILMDMSQIYYDYEELINSAYGMLEEGGVLLIQLLHLTKTDQEHVILAITNFTTKHFLGLSTVDGFIFTWNNSKFPLSIDQNYLLSWQNLDTSAVRLAHQGLEVCLAAITKNEAGAIAGMIRAAHPFITSAVFVDNQSDDTTVELIRATCDELSILHKIHLSDKNRFDDLRNEMLSIVPPTADWILVLDADERLCVRDLVAFKNLICRKNDLFGLPRIHLKPEGDKIVMVEHRYPDTQARLFRANRGMFYVNPVHEAVVGYQNHGMAPCYGKAEAPGGPHIFHLKNLIRTEAEDNEAYEHYRALMRISRPLAYDEANEMYASVETSRSAPEEITIPFDLMHIKDIHKISGVINSLRDIKVSENAPKLRQGPTAMFIMTAHGSFIFQDTKGNLIHCSFADAGDDLTPVEIDLNSLHSISAEKFDIPDGAMAGYRMVFSPSGVNFSLNDIYLCAEPTNPVLATRTATSIWEAFRFIPTNQKGIETLKSSLENEMIRFRSRVVELIELGEPVKIHCGAGPVPRQGFLNLDIIIGSPNFYLSNIDDYFIFPFADLKWDIPDDCVDYVFHEDFIEHIDQTSQFQFLAETLRVMKPGSWHRVNTPNLLTAMKQKSDFGKGFDGVYTGEREWQHVAIFSPTSLKEVAETIGYKAVVFTTRSCGVSPYAEPDLRPGADRDDVLGNIYADLLK